jgi:hypothetical protein
LSTDSPESNRKAQIDALLLKLPEVVTRLTQALAKAGADKELLAQINATGCDTEISYAGADGGED